MTYFTYELPFPESKLLDGIIHMLKKENLFDVAFMLKGANLQIEQGGYSHYDGGGRSDALAAYVTVLVNPSCLDVLDTQDTKSHITRLCDKLIPPNVGYDVKSTSFSMDLTKDFDLEDDLIIELEQRVNSFSARIIRDIMPEDVRNKGYQMTECYIYLYVVENSLRLFIAKVCKEKYGESFYDGINIPRALRNTIQRRRENAENNKWLSIRGEDLFYLDFKDLGALIDNNWQELFEAYFPSRDFIIPKLNEMAECRNLIAHNSYISDTVNIRTTSDRVFA